MVQCVRLWRHGRLLGWEEQEKQEEYDRRVFSEPDIVKNINISRMGWVGHVIRMGNDQIPKRHGKTRWHHEPGTT
ncbi:hypothetical protein J437_LFUL012521 [Ladona fulva]|uniref:Uncharacterized protein n=1 Tax=Ladona fulva TaxID=123851 RepID=A0A8K0K2J7_LADFU|nr:hypothetical protein J437_LFUL012521 [Ladona fulva]